MVRWEPWLGWTSLATSYVLALIQEDTDTWQEPETMSFMSISVHNCEKACIGFPCKDVSNFISHSTSTGCVITYSFKLAWGGGGGGRDLNCIHCNSFQDQSHTSFIYRLPMQTLDQFETWWFLIIKNWTIYHSANFVMGSFEYVKCWVYEQYLKKKKELRIHSTQVQLFTFWDVHCYAKILYWIRARMRDREYALPSEVFLVRGMD